MDMSNADKPKVSVIITTYYRNEYLQSCLESVRDQTYNDLEVIVVDDSGEEYAKSIAQQFECNYLGLETNLGPSGARNQGFQCANGQYIQFVDDDDWLYPEKIERQVEVLRKNHEVVVVYCGRRMETGTLEYPCEELRCDALASVLTFDNNPCVTSTMLIRADPLREIHPFEDFEGASDTPIKIELARRGKYEYVDDILVRAGENDSNMGSTWKNIDAKWQILEAYGELYSQFPPSIKRKAIASIYRTTGRRHLEEHVWSLNAIICFGQSIIYNPEPNITDIGEFIASLGGRPLRSLAASLLT